MGSMKFAIALSCALAAAVAHANDVWSGEQVKQWTTDSGVRVLVNSPSQIDEHKPTRLIIYALPNGNTIEQTLGSEFLHGKDWHFYIQHIAAQTRKLRSIDSAENIVLACV